MSVPDTPSYIIRGEPKFPAEVENGSRTPFTTFPLESILPPGLYMAVAHNGPLRRRIQDHSDELEEFMAHVRHAQRLLPGWLATLYHLIMVVVRHVLVCAVVFTSSRVDLTAFLKGHNPVWSGFTGCASLPIFWRYPVKPGSSRGHPSSSPLAHDLGFCSRSQWKALKVPKVNRQSRTVPFQPGGVTLTTPRPLQPTLGG